MKTLISTLIIIAAIPARSLVCAGEAGAPTVTDDSRADAILKLQRAREAQGEDRRKLEEIEAQMEKMRAADQLYKKGSEPWELALTDRVQSSLRRVSGGGVGKALIVRSTEDNPESQANLEEDLAV